MALTTLRRSKLTILCQHYVIVKIFNLMERKMVEFFFLFSKLLMKI